MTDRSIESRSTTLHRRGLLSGTAATAATAGCARQAATDPTQVDARSGPVDTRQTASPGRSDGRFVAQPGSVQSTIVDVYEEYSRGYVLLDPRREYTLEDVDVPPYVTVDCNGARVQPGGNANVFNVAPGGLVTKGTVDVAGSAVEGYSAIAIDCSGDYWTTGAGSDLIKGPEAPMHEPLSDGAGDAMYWGCRAPVSDMVLLGNDTDHESIGVRFHTTVSGIAFIAVSNLYIKSFHTGLNLHCDDYNPRDNRPDGQGFINGNEFNQILLDAQTNAAMRLSGTDPDINANNFINIQIQPQTEAGSNGTDHCVVIGTGEGNRWIGHIWDAGKMNRYSMWLKEGDEDNWGAGDQNIFHLNHRGLSKMRQLVRDDVDTRHSGFMGHASGAIAGIGIGRPSLPDAAYVGIDPIEESGKEGGTIIGANGANSGAYLPGDTIHVGAEARSNTIELAGHGVDEDGESHVWTDRIGFEIRSPSKSVTSDGDGRDQLFACQRGGITVTLASADATQHNEIIVKDGGANAGSNSITVESEGPATIDGQDAISIASDYGSVHLISNGSEWYVASDSR